ncbi:hypothetical protein G3I23_41905, partial [Streptomyces sp. SID10115]|nr:hypothetical protein [Streptomyces sp. SID10115]
MHDEPAQQREPVGLGERQPQPERRPELPARGEGFEHREVRRRIRHPQQHLTEKPRGPPRAVPGPARRSPAPELHQRIGELPQSRGQLRGPPLPPEQQQSLHHGPDPVPRHGQGAGGGKGRCRGAARRSTALFRDGRAVPSRPPVPIQIPIPVHQCSQSPVHVQMRALEPVRQFLVGEAVTRARRYEEPLREHRRSPARTAVEACRPREGFLEGGPVQFPVAGAEAAPCRLVDLAGHPRREAAHRAPAQPVGRREPHRDPQAEQVQVGAEDVLAARGARRRGVRCRAPHFGEEAQGQWVPGVGGGQRVVRDAVERAGPARLGFRQIPEAYAAGELRAVRRRVQRRRVEVGSGLLPVLRAARDDEPGARVPQPACRARAPLREVVGEDGRHFLGAVEQEEERSSRVPYEPGQPVGPHVA